MSVSIFSGIESPLGHQDIEASQLATLAECVRLVDVREVDEFDGELGHVPGAELVPLGELAGAAEGWRKDQPVLLICRSGNRSGQAAKLLCALGFEDVANLSGGMLAVRTAQEKT